MSTGFWKLHLVEVWKVGLWFEELNQVRGQSTIDSRKTTPFRVTSQATILFGSINKTPWNLEILHLGDSIEADSTEY